ncbi:MAG: hypothetical protein SFX73_40510 [Kofleriaceae bacterium]|nr:hypothetical protein [Kofleriaceae bacterium]
MDAFERERETSVPATVHNAWEAVVADWDNPATHDALFALTAQHRVYAWTAARYREARAARPPGAADPHLERMRKAAEATLLVTATQRDSRKQPYMSSFIVLALVAFMIVVGMMFAMYMRGRGPREAKALPVNSAGSPAAASSQVR